MSELSAIARDILDIEFTRDSGREWFETDWIWLFPYQTVRSYEHALELLRQKEQELQWT